MISSFKTIFRFLKLSFKIDKKFIYRISIDILINILLTLLALFMVRDFTEYLQIGNIKNISIKLIFDAIVFVVLRIFKEVLKWKVQYSAREYLLKMEKKLLKKSTEIDYFNLESPAFHNLQERARFSLRNQYCLENLLEAIVKSIEHISIMLTTFIAIGYFSFYLSIVLLILFVVNILAKKKYSKEESKFYENLSPINRKYWYYNYMVLNRDDVLDIKSNEFESFIDNKFSKTIKDILKCFKPFYRNKAIVNIIEVINSILCTLFVIIFSASRVYKNEISFSDFSFTVVGILKFTSSMNEFSENIIDLDRFSKYTIPVLDFIEFGIEKNKERSVESKDLGLIAKNIYFKYGNSKNYVLNDISFEVKKPKIVVIIGENGAGKSTLIKLISGLYEASKGSLTYDGKSIYETENKYISTIFQDFKLIDDITLRENICYKLIENECEKEIVDEEIFKIIDKLGIKKEDFKINLDDKLGVELDDGNIELSGGQAQLIAILRAIYKNSPILVLDEPTGSLDIEKENSVYKILKNIKEDKIIFMISHRMASVHIADEIWFMKDGKIHFGNHNELIENSLEYKELYLSQAERYI